jgi:Ca2+-binding EF-hand superfamily protein
MATTVHIWTTFDSLKTTVEMLQAVLGADAKLLADSLFKVFDEDNSGSLDFAEYIMALNATR